VSASNVSLSSPLIYCFLCIIHPDTWVSCNLYGVCCQCWIRFRSNFGRICVWCIWSGFPFTSRVTFDLYQFRTIKYANYFSILCCNLDVGLAICKIRSHSLGRCRIFRVGLGLCPCCLLGWKQYWRIAFGIYVALQSNPVVEMVDPEDLGRVLGLMWGFAGIGALISLPIPAQIQKTLGMESMGFYTGEKYAESDVMLAERLSL